MRGWAATAVGARAAATAAEATAEVEMGVVMAAEAMAAAREAAARAAATGTAATAVGAKAAAMAAVEMAAARAAAGRAGWAGRAGGEGGGARAAAARWAARGDVVEVGVDLAEGGVGVVGVVPADGVLACVVGGVVGVVLAYQRRRVVVRLNLVAEARARAPRHRAQRVARVLLALQDDRAVGRRARRRRAGWRRRRERRVRRAGRRVRRRRAQTVLVRRRAGGVVTLQYSLVTSSRRRLTGGRADVVGGGELQSVDVNSSRRGWAPPGNIQQPEGMAASSMEKKRKPAPVASRRCKRRNRARRRAPCPRTSLQRAFVDYAVDAGRRWRRRRRRRTGRRRRAYRSRGSAAHGKEA